MKLKVIWNPATRDAQEWIVDTGNPAWEIAYPVEQVTDWGWSEFFKRLGGTSPTAWRALLWALRKQDEPRLPIDYVTINWDELSTESQCPRCEEWFGSLLDHECALPAAEDETPVEDGEGRPEA